MGDKYFKPCDRCGEPRDLHPTWESGGWAAEWICEECDCVNLYRPYDEDDLEPRKISRRADQQ